jgi:hypothetical protein
MSDWSRTDAFISTASTTSGERKLAVGAGAVLPLRCVQSSRRIQSMIGSMFQVEIRISHEGKLIDEMSAMRIWLDHKRFEATTLRSTFAPPGVIFSVDFMAEGEAIAFAVAFGGRVSELGQG